jgi:hypothetical protein
MAPDDLRELLRFRLHDVTESYNMRVISSGAELWRLSYRGETLEKTEQLHTFGNPQEALSFLLALKERLTKEGWANGA